MAILPLGWIEPKKRTKPQHDAHAAAMGAMIQFALPLPMLAKGQAVRLFDSWKKPEVVADVGFVFDRIHQITGSCVQAGGTNALFSTIAIQRVASENPTKAFLPFTYHNYAASRHAIGEDGQGEGSLGSTFAASLKRDGIIAWDDSSGLALPKYTHTDGIMTTQQIEMQWSSYRYSGVEKVLAVSGAHLLGSAAECRTVVDIRAMVLNGYGVPFACNNYIGNATVKGSGTKARVMGRWDGRGGHQQSILAVEEHEDFGPIYWAQNNWPGSTYPKDPGGGPVCGCWVLEKDVEAAMKLDSEVYGLSHQEWFPAQPNVIETDWGQA